MSKYLVDSADMTAIADAIRGKTGDSSPMTVANMPTEIDSIPSSGTDYMAQRVQGTLTSYNIPNTCTKISNGTFAGATSLQSVTIPSTITSIGQQAFYGCNSLQSVSIAQGPITIGIQAFAGCSSLQSITLPSTIRNIYSEAFVNSGLRSISMSGVRRIDAYAFSSSDLESVTVPYNATLGTGIFYNCESLLSVTFQGLYIPNDAFLDCTNLTSILTSGNIASVGSDAFKNTKLTGDIYVGRTCSFDSGCFKNINTSGTIYIHLPATSNISTAYTMSNTAFDKTICKLVVPSGTLSTYQTYYNYYYYEFIEEGSY